ncbi:MAG TPA: type II toxin-antitoxin system prevent-host-death family antitoxin [Vicinamibacterales bacterium]|nr:type II toxin-antitoxin system prevent-host-death family antitoxin [Vicinamibacterales bacterium]
MSAKRTRGRAAGGRNRRVVAAAEFKTTCLELFDRVRETGTSYIVTKHGVPVAVVGPYIEPRRPSSFFGMMKGSVLDYERPFDPVDGDYEID